MDKNSKGLIYWLPRILSILFICFLMLFSLDVFEPGASVKDIAIGLFMHNIPALILLVITIIAWKHEIVGGVAFILAGILYLVLVIQNGVPLLMVLSWSLTISGPAFLIGILYLVGWFKKRKH